MPSRKPPPFGSRAARDWPESVQVLAQLGPWFETARRELPWRARNLDAPHPDPYAVLVSELMLQQTRVAAVVPYFERWMRAFPDAASLAAAGEEEVHKLWEGLGYYRRARHLQATARALASSDWPRNLAGLLELPGLGPYSAAAVAAIAFQLPEPALDGNALRVVARLLALADPRAVQDHLRGWLRPALACFGPSRTTQGIMELGATVCLPRSPHCTECPLAGSCLARNQGVAMAIPEVQERAAPKEVELWLVALQAEDSWLLERPASKGLLAGLWRWPAVEVPSDLPIAAENLQLFGQGFSGMFYPWIQTYTHRRERIQPCKVRMEFRPGAGPDQEWIPTIRLSALPMGRRDQRLRAMLLSNEIPMRGPVPNEAILGALRGT